MPNEPIKVNENLAKAIVKLSDSSNAILNSGLNERALITLLHDYTSVSKRTIKKVLEGMTELRSNYTNG